MFENIEAPGMRRKTKYVIGGAVILAIIAILTVGHFTSEDRCIVAVLESGKLGAYGITSDETGRVKLGQDVVPCDCLPGYRSFWTMFHSCPKPVGYLPGDARLIVTWK
jgi:hypothetical protein